MAGQAIGDKRRYAAAKELFGVGLQRFMIGGHRAARRGQTDDQVDAWIHGRHYPGEVILWCVRGTFGIPFRAPMFRKWLTGEERFLCRAVYATGQTIDFLLTAKRDAAVAKRFFRRALANPGNGMPRVINVDKNRAYPVAVEDLKEAGDDPAALPGCGSANT